MEQNLEQIDFLVVAAHPDDVELSAGGTVAKLTREGRSVILVDFTEGEMGSRGTAEIRAEEAKKAAEVLGARERINLHIPDCGVQPTDENVKKAIQLIRQYRPKAVIMNPEYERHPDHEAVHRIMRTAMFKSGLTKLFTDLDGKPQQPYRTRKMYSYMQAYGFKAKFDFLVDISDTFEIKMEAIYQHASQVYVPGVSDPNGPVTRLSRPEFIEELEARAMYFGTLIGVRYAEPFCSIEPVWVESLGKLI